MTMNIQREMTFVRTYAGTPDVDLAQRIIRNVCIATIGLASDGWIILPSGIDVKNYSANPVVTSRHLAGSPDALQVNDGSPVVIARCLGLLRTSDELIAEAIQFADTRQGRDYAYLYGVNNSGPDGKPEVYMRAWSIEGPVLNRTEISFERARELSGQYWDDATAARVRKLQKKVFVAGDMTLAAFAAVVVGADKNALSRAAAQGVETAGEIVARMDLDAAGGELADLKKLVGDQNAKIARLEQEIQALRSEGASAAAQRDSEAVLQALREMRLTLSGRN
jgi:hypothetical protein